MLNIMSSFWNDVLPIAMALFICKRSIAGPQKLFARFVLALCALGGFAWIISPIQGQSSAWNVLMTVGLVIFCLMLIVDIRHGWKRSQSSK